MLDAAKTPALPCPTCNTPTKALWSCPCGETHVTDDDFPTVTVDCSCGRQMHLAAGDDRARCPSCHGRGHLLCACGCGQPATQIAFEGEPWAGVCVAEVEASDARADQARAAAHEALQADLRRVNELRRRGVPTREAIRQVAGELEIDALEDSLAVIAGGRARGVGAIEAIRQARVGGGR